MNIQIPSIIEATQRYEAWLAKHIDIVPNDLAKKHEDMATDKYSHLRATYYRWAQLFPLICRELVKRKKVRSIGDAHARNFGIYLNADDERVFGANDFDEAFLLPYANDPLRVLASVIIAIEQGGIEVKPETACAVILNGYFKGLKHGPKPFLLSENRDLEAMADSQARNPKHYWEKFRQLPLATAPKKVLRLLKSELPQSLSDFRVVSRIAGEGSLGRERFDILAPKQGDAELVEEAKIIVPSASMWAMSISDSQSDEDYLQEMLQLPTRSVDPDMKEKDGWLLRRLSPAYGRIELAQLASKKEQEILLHAMGFDMANIHLATPNSRQRILRDLDEDSSKLFLQAAYEMLEVIDDDFQAWKRHWNEQKISDSR